jgi:putative oxidoreductase
MSEKPAAAKQTPGTVDWILGNATSVTALTWAIVPLRLLIGVIMALHGSQKAFGWFGGPEYSGVVDMLAGLGFPAPSFFAALLVAGELGCGLMLFFGVATRIGGGLLVTIMAVALLTAHRGDPFSQTHAQQLLLASGVLFIVAGGGQLSLMPAAVRRAARFEATPPAA